MKAQIGLGLLYAWGLGTGHDYAKAYHWFDAAVQQQPSNIVIRTLARTNREFVERQLGPEAIKRLREKSGNDSVIRTSQQETSDSHGTETPAKKVAARGASLSFIAIDLYTPE